MRRVSRKVALRKSGVALSLAMPGPRDRGGAQVLTNAPPERLHTVGRACAHQSRLKQIKLLLQKRFQLRRQNFSELLDLVHVDLIGDDRKYRLDLTAGAGTEASPCLFLDRIEKIVEMTGFRLRF